MKICFIDVDSFTSWLQKWLNYNMNPNISTLTGSLKSLFFSLATRDLGLVVRTNKPHRMWEPQKCFERF